jgi:hypothetical protein
VSQALGRLDTPDDLDRFLQRQLVTEASAEKPTGYVNTVPEK